MFIPRIVLIALFSCVFISTSYAKAPKPEPVNVLIKFKANVPDSKKDEVLKNFHLSKHHRIDQINVDVLKIDPKTKAKDIADAIKLKHKDIIEFAEPDAFVEPNYIPNDPYFSQEWHMSNIQSSAAWDTTKGNPAVIIAILDSGIDSTHPDLIPNLVAGWNFYDNNSTLNDVSGHGTAVAGTSAAAMDDSLGPVGACGNCKIMPLRITDANGYGLASSIASALTYAADHGARVANISYGTVTTISSIDTAAQYFQSKGGVVTASAGNDGTVSTLPDNPHFLLVSATSPSNLIESWSTTGTNVDLSAPGENILTTMVGGGYGGWNGTSFSAPLVAGVAGLIYSINPKLNADAVQNILKNSADDLGPTGWDPQYGWGRLNAYKAVNMAVNSIDLQTPSAPSNCVAIIQSSTSVKINCSGLSTDNVMVSGYNFYRDGTQVGTASTPTFLSSGLTAGATYTFSVKAFDSSSNLSASSNLMTVTMPAGDTTPPSAPTNLTASAPDSTKVNLTWSASTDNVAVSSYNVYRNNTKIGTATSTTYTDTTVSAGTSYAYSVAACDAAGNCSSASASSTVTVPAASLQIINVSVSNKTGTSAKINWQTTVLASGYVKYGTSSSNLSLISPTTSLGTVDNMALSGLNKRTTYYYQVVALDTTGKIVNSSISSFKTATK